MKSKDNIESNALVFPQLFIDPAARVAKVDGKEISLTPKEFDLLYFQRKIKTRYLTEKKY